MNKFAVIFGCLLAGCATGSYHRTVVTEHPNGTKTVAHEVKQTGAWFTSGKATAIEQQPADPLAMPAEPTPTSGQKVITK